jgi:hypothetical protein
MVDRIDSPWQNMEKNSSIVSNPKHLIKNIDFSSDCYPKFKDNEQLILKYCKENKKSSTNILFIFIIFIFGVGIGILIYYFISKR